MKGVLGFSRQCGRLVLLGAALPWAACAHADTLTAAPGPQGPEVMLYFKQPLGAPRTARVYGLRIDQASLTPAVPGATNVALIGRRELLDLEVGGPAGMRLDIGRRLTWDFSRHQFNSPGSTEMAVRLPAATSSTARALALP